MRKLKPRNPLLVSRKYTDNAVKKNPCISIQECTCMCSIEAIPRKIYYGCLGTVSTANKVVIGILEDRKKVHRVETDLERTWRYNFQDNRIYQHQRSNQQLQHILQQIEAEQ